MNKKWAAKRKNVNLAEPEVAALERYCEKTGRTETEVLREALRRFLNLEATEEELVS